MNLKYRIF